MFIVTEFCNGGDLSNCLEEYYKKYKRAFPENIVQYLMRQIISAIKYLHDNKILHRDLKLDNILVCFDNEEARKQKNMLKATIKIIDFGFARYLKNEELAISVLGSPINMEPGILKKLNKIDYGNEFGYDEKADIWSLGTLTYEMLVGKCTFDADSMENLVKRVEKGDYILPTSLSKEAVSFLNSMLQYDYKRRLTASQLSRHKFLTKNVQEFHPINLNEIIKHVKGSNIELNTRLNQSIWNVFGQDSVFLDKIGIEDFPLTENNENKNRECIICRRIWGCRACEEMIRRRKILENEKLNEKKLNEEFMRIFELMNDNFIYISPKLIPIILGDNPEVVNNPFDFFDDNKI